MSLPRVVAIAPGSAAARSGLAAGDEIVAIGGVLPRDVLEYRWLADAADVDLDIRRDGQDLKVRIDKAHGEALGAEIDAAIFDQVRTCDNHCEFCFIYQLPPGLRSSLYLKDDDYRLSFLYGNFTTLTRFTESDLERVLDEGLAPLFVSIHTTDPDRRAAMLRNRRGATSLRWLKALLDHGVEVHGQIVVCPGVNDGLILEETFAGILDRFSELASVCVVPLGVSRFNSESSMRPHTPSEVSEVLLAVERWQAVFTAILGRRMIFAADEYYVLAGAALPAEEGYEGFPQHENGVGMLRTFEAEFAGSRPGRANPGGFFAWVDGAPATGYRAPRVESTSLCLPTRKVRQPVTVLTGAYGVEFLRKLVASLPRTDVEVVGVENRFFGGNIGVSGLLVGQDVGGVLAGAPSGRRYLLPDVCLSNGRFLDGTRPEDLPQPVEVVPCDGAALRQALQR